MVEFLRTPSPLSKLRLRRACLTNPSVLRRSVCGMFGSGVAWSWLRESCTAAERVQKACARSLCADCAMSIRAAILLLATLPAIAANSQQQQAGMLAALPEAGAVPSPTPPFSSDLEAECREARVRVVRGRSSRMPRSSCSAQAAGWVRIRCRSGTSAWMGAPKNSAAPTPACPQMRRTVIR